MGKLPDPVDPRKPSTPSSNEIHEWICKRCGFIVHAAKCPDECPECTSKDIGEPEE